MHKTVDNQKLALRFLTTEIITALNTFLVVIIFVGYYCTFAFLILYHT